MQDGGRGTRLTNAAVAWRVGSVTVILVLAEVLRVANLGAVGFASDEAVYAGQAAAAAGDQARAALFSLFRAHPVLVQVLVGAVFRIFGVADVPARALVGFGFGVTTVGLLMVLAWRVYGRGVALIAGLVLAVMPYHVMVTRQVILDGPMTFFLVLAAVCAERAAATGSERSFVAMAAAVGAATITKETAILAAPALVLALVAARRTAAISVRSLLLASAVGGASIAPFVLSRMLRSENAGETLLWQLTRPSNHSPDYFVASVLAYIGPVVFALALAGTVLQFRRRSAGDLIIAIPTVLFLVFHQLWPTKLLPYLVVIAPGLAVAAAWTLVELLRAIAARATRARMALAATLAVVVVAPLLMASVEMVRAPGGRSGRIVDRGPPVATFAGAREVGLWAAKATPRDARFLTIGPSLGNIVAFYGARPFVALSVSPDPQRRNPAYVPVPNPDAAIRNGAIDYIVWDAYSARRSRFSGDRALRYARKYHGIPVLSVVEGMHGVEVVAGGAPDDAEVVAIVFSVQNGDPFGDVDPDVPQ